MWRFLFVRGLTCSIVLLQLIPILNAQTFDKARVVSEAVPLDSTPDRDQALQQQSSNLSPEVNGAFGTSDSASDSQRANTHLINSVRDILDKYYDRPPNTRDDSPWKLLHWSIAYGIDAQVRAGGPHGEQVSAIGWLCENRPSTGIRLMSPNSDGLQLPIAAGKQGHPGQFLAMLAQSQVQPDFGIRVENQRLTIGDLVTHERNTCRTGMELTFKLIGIAHYGRSEDVWKNSRGEQWSVRRLLEEELKQPISARSTCGGTHRLFALSYAVHCRRKEGLPIDGPWGRAARRTDEYQARAFRLQNDDGSFSTAWFDRQESSSSLKRRLTTSGHVAEWLAFSLSENGLHDERFEKGLKYLTSLSDKNQAAASSWGAMTHALHALAIYEQRVLGVSPGQRRQPWFETNDSTTHAAGRQTGNVSSREEPNNERTAANLTRK